MNSVYDTFIIKWIFTHISMWYGHFTVLSKVISGFSSHPAFGNKHLSACPAPALGAQLDFGTSGELYWVNFRVLTMIFGIPQWEFPIHWIEPPSYHPFQEDFTNEISHPAIGVSLWIPHIWIFDGDINERLCTTVAFWTFDAEPGSEWKRTTAMYLVGPFSIRNCFRNCISEHFYNTYTVCIYIYIYIYIYACYMGIYGYSIIRCYKIYTIYNT